MSGASSCSAPASSCSAGGPNEEVSIEEIAEAAGVSKGLLYHYFPTKKDFIRRGDRARGRQNSTERAATRPLACLPRRNSTPASTASSTTSRSTRPPTLRSSEAAAATLRSARCWSGRARDPDEDADAGSRELGALAGQHRALAASSNQPSRAGSSSSRARSCAGSNRRTWSADQLRHAAESGSGRGALRGPRRRRPSPSGNGRARSAGRGVARDRRARLVDPQIGARANSSSRRREAVELGRLRRPAPGGPAG